MPWHSAAAGGRALERTFFAAAEDDERRSGQREERRIDGHHVVENLLVATSKRDHRRHGALQCDRHHRRPGARMQPSDVAKEYSVPCHGIVHPGGGQHSLAQEADCGDGDPGSDEPRTCRPQCAPHDLRRRRGGCSQPVAAQDRKQHGIHAKIEHDHAEDAEHQPARQVSPRFTQLAAHEACRLPTTIREQHRHHCRAKREQCRPRHGERLRRRRRCFPHPRTRTRTQPHLRPPEPQPPQRHQHEQSRDLGDHEGALNVASSPRAKAVHSREHGKRCYRDHRRGYVRRRQLAEVEGEGHRDGSHPAGLNYQQERPSVQERDERVPGIPKVGVHAPDARTPHRQLRVYERAGERYRAADSPREHDHRGRVESASDDVRVNEDPRPDDPAHHDHRRVEGAEMAR